MGALPRWNSSSGEDTIGGGKPMEARRVYKIGGMCKNKKRAQREGDGDNNALGSGEGEVVPLRFERGLREPKTLVLPLHHGTSAIIRAYCSDLRCKFTNVFPIGQSFLGKYFSLI